MLKLSIAVTGLWMFSLVHQLRLLSTEKPAHGGGGRGAGGAGRGPAITRQVSLLFPPAELKPQAVNSTRLLGLSPTEVVAGHRMDRQPTGMGHPPGSTTTSWCTVTRTNRVTRGGGVSVPPSKGRAAGVKVAKVRSDVNEQERACPRRGPSTPRREHTQSGGTLGVNTHTASEQGLGDR